MNYWSSLERIINCMQMNNYPVNIWNMILLFYIVKNGIISTIYLQLPVAGYIIGRLHLFFISSYDRKVFSNNTLTIWFNMLQHMINRQSIVADVIISNWFRNYDARFIIKFRYSYKRMINRLVDFIVKNLNMAESIEIIKTKSKYYMNVIKLS